MSLQPGQPVAVRTPDRREFRGVLLQLRQDDQGRDVALVRLDTGWETTYPVEMVQPLTPEPRRT